MTPTRALHNITQDYPQNKFGLARYQHFAPLERAIAAMDRTMINDTINLLFITVTYNRRALPLGWVRVPHEGNSDLKLQQRLLNWFAECLPEGARRRTTIIADREFHSIHLATWIETTLGLNFVLRIKAGTWAFCHLYYQVVSSL